MLRLQHSVRRLGAVAPLLSTLPLLVMPGPDTDTTDNTAVVECSVSTYNANTFLEDRHFFHRVDGLPGGPCLFMGVMDGHGGWQAAEFTRDTMPGKLEDHVKTIAGASAPVTDAEAAKPDPSAIGEALVKTYQQVDAAFADIIRPAFKLGFTNVARVGCCAVSAVITKSHVVVANAGDCRAVVARAQSGKVQAIDLSEDHNAKFAKEKNALAEAHPGEKDVVVCKSVDSCYVKGRLQPTRAIGDMRLKDAEFNVPPNQPHRGRTIPQPYTPPYITSTPEVRVHDVDAKADTFVLLACDGVWDVLSSQEAVEFVASDDGPRATVAARLAEHVLRKEAEANRMGLQELLNIKPGRRRSSHDDLTITIAFLNTTPAKKSSWWPW